MSAVYLNAIGALCALGEGLDAMRAPLFACDQPRGVAPTDAYTPGRFLHLGCLPPLTLPALDHAPLGQRSRNNALALAALRQIQPQVAAAVERFGPRRVAVIIGTSTAGVAEGERAAAVYQSTGSFPAGYDYAQQEMGSVADHIARELGVSGPAHVISTACSSGAKALASAARLLRANIVDAVVAGGVDALSAFTIAGFSALESVAAGRCNPMSRHRDGINIGEGAAMFLMSREGGPVRLAGWGESSDAHHMSAPDPSARGAIDAMSAALRRAGISPATIDYINLHGTATPHNDAMESRAVSELFGAAVAVSSTKPLTGHTLAAAGAIEAAIACLTLLDNPAGRLPPHWWDGQADPELAALHLVRPGATLGRTVKYVLSNSFAFGGSNATLILAGA